MTSEMTSGVHTVPIFCRSMVCACSLWVAGCAGPGLFNNAPDAPPFSNPAMSMQNASDAIVVGKTNKADVMAALGAATVINFDSGFEVWVYRAKSREPAETKAEFVVLFAPDGIVKKTRLRPAYPQQN